MVSFLDETRTAGPAQTPWPAVWHQRSDTAWRRHGITADQVTDKNHPIGDGAPRLWELARELIKEATARGDLAR